MNQHALLILCHEDPEHLWLLLDSLAGPNAHFFLHVDLKADIDQFAALINRDDVTLVAPRVKVIWGGWSQVQAALNSIATARRSKVDFDYFSLLSGSHFPLRSKAEIFNYFDQQSFEYINITEVTFPNKDKPLARRFTRYFFEGAQRPIGQRMSVLNRIQRLITRLTLRSPAASLSSWSIYWGSQWWTLTRQAIEMVERTAREQSGLIRFFHHVHCPDESFFQTVLGNTGFLGRCRRSPIYTDWSNPREAPCFIRMEHVEKILDPNFRVESALGAHPVIFARKFGSRNRAVVERISDATTLR